MSAPRTIAIAAVIVGLGCASATPGIELTDRWPDKPRSYTTVTKAWTRSGRLMDGYHKVIEVHATLKSPEWRAAYVERKAKNEGLTGSERASLVAAQKKANADHWELQLLVSTYDRRENDLNRGAKSVWRVALLDDQGKRVAPLDIARDRRPVGVLRALYPKLGDFDMAYVAKFPRTIQVLRPGASKVSLRVAGPRGAVVLEWTPDKSKK